MSIRQLQSYLGGRWCTSPGDRWTDDLNPSDTNDVIARTPRGAPDDATAAAAAAAEGLPRWRGLSGPARAEHLYQWAGVLAARQDELAHAISREVGKPVAEARGEVTRGVVILRYYAGEAVRPVGDVIPAQTSGALQFSLREPLGVVALITPWNFPLAIPLWKAAPALAFGNTVVLKPAEVASHVATLLASTAEQAGLPPGAFNVVLGSGSVIGDPLLAHPAVRGVSFTGSGMVGARVAAAASARNIKFQTEMGGKNVLIVVEDADLDRAAALAANGAMRYAGQKCTATSRAVVVASVAEAFLSKLVAQVEALPLGPVEDPKAVVGPMITADARASVHQTVTESGFAAVTGGKPANGAYSRGFFYQPTVLRDVDPTSRVATEELFGPVLAVMTASDMDHAIAIANAGPYGLSASLMTRDLGAALDYIHRIEAGLVRVNGDTTGVDPHAPFGGMKGSSSGSREQGPAAREFYTEIKTVQLNP